MCSQFVRKYIENLYKIRRHNEICGMSSYDCTEIVGGINGTVNETGVESTK